MNYLFPELEKERKIDYQTGQIYFWPVDEVEARSVEESPIESIVKDNPCQLLLFTTEQQNYLFN